MKWAFLFLSFSHFGTAKVQLGIDLGEGRMIASQGQFVEFESSCDLFSSPKLEQKIGRLSKGKKIWVETAAGEALKVYRKKGPAYLSSSCP